MTVTASGTILQAMLVNVSTDGAFDRTKAVRIGVRELNDVFALLPIFIWNSFLIVLNQDLM